MTDKQLQGLAMQALNLTKADRQYNRWHGFLLASYHNGGQLYRMRKVERTIIDLAGEDWLNHGALKDRAFGILRLATKVLKPDAVIFVTAINKFISTPKLHALPQEEIDRILDAGHDCHHKAAAEGLLELQDAFMANAQTAERVCTCSFHLRLGVELCGRRQGTSGGRAGGLPQVSRRSNRQASRRDEQARLGDAARQTGGRMTTSTETLPDALPVLLPAVRGGLDRRSRREGGGARGEVSREEVTGMPVLNDSALVSLRADQGREAIERRRCSKCEAQVWKNYCRSCGEYFTDGHHVTCDDVSKHQSERHRTY